MLEMVRGREAALRRGERWPWFRNLCHDIVTSEAFDRSLSVVIILNAVTVGLDSHFWLRWKEHGETAGVRIFEFIELMFLFIYTLECGIRFFAHRLDALHS